MKAKIIWKPIPRMPTEAEIREHAHLLYVRSGWIAGRDLENWLEAEAHLTALAHREAAARVAPLVFAPQERSRSAVARRTLQARNLPVMLKYPGHHAQLRCLEPHDAGHLLEFFASHTPETIHQRYGCYFTHMTAETAARLVGVDQTRDAALGIFEMAGRGTRLVAIGRYCLIADGRSAELAFVVHESRRSLGLGTLLLDVLVAIARERGLDRLIAQVQHDNTPMRAMLHHVGATFKPIPGTGEMLATLSLAVGQDAVRRRTRSEASHGQRQLSRPPRRGSAARRPALVPPTGNRCSGD